MITTIIEKQTFINDKYVLNLGITKIPLEVISTFVKVLILWYVAYTAFNYGQMITGDNLKVAMYLHDKGCEPKAKAGGLEWVCTNKINMNGTLDPVDLEGLNMNGVVVRQNQSINIGTPAYDKRILTPS